MPEKTPLLAPKLLAINRRPGGIPGTRLIPLQGLDRHGRAHENV